MDRYICIHGHFYQPPRENPWLEDVEVQDSAHPYHDWNERITFECYAPNAASRLLDGRGRIMDIVNNYRQISFNFGPTLLSWMKRHAPDIHEKIVEADRLSVRDRSGHGNALAQVYNHLIMPLASRRDKVTQVRWGIRDFESRFGRKPEGMWLAETAVDAETLEILCDHGITFTLLSPTQVRRVKPLRDSNDWQNVDKGQVDPSRAYRWTSPKGKSLALFFYDAPISRAVAFEGLLNSGEGFAQRLLQGFSNERRHPQLVHIATDSESYGHHHRFGDMALAFALRKIQSEGSAALTNYGEFLEKHPPEWEAEIIENSAWSCAHGVERWNSDCGCHIGTRPGWTQSWRGPLRKALTALSEGLDDLFEAKGGKLLKSPWTARDAYVEVLLDRTPETLGAFFAEHQTHPLAPEEQSAALKLLEMERHRLLMFTSCAWFFDEISGIETVTVLWSAARAIQLARDHGEALALEADFLLGLTRAASNIPALRDGEKVYRRYVTPVVTDLPRVAAHEAVESLFQPLSDEASLYCYRIAHLEKDRVSSDGNVLSIGRVRVSSTITGEAFETSYAAIHLGGHDVHAVLKTFPDVARHVEMKESLVKRFTEGTTTEVLGQLYRVFDPQVYTLHDLLLEERRRLLGALIAEIASRYDPVYRSLVDENRRLIRMIQSADMPVPEVFLLALQYVLGRELESSLAGLPKDSAVRRLGELREEVDRFGLRLDWDQAGRILRQLLEDEMRPFFDGFSPARAKRLLVLLTLGERLNLPLNLWKMENMFFELIRGPFRTLSGEDQKIASELGERLRFPPMSV